MPLLSDAEARTLHARILLLAFHIILLVGTVTILYPFALMVGNSLRCQVDRYESGILPSYLWDDDALARKVIAEPYLSIAEYNKATGEQIYSWADIEPGDVDIKGKRFAFMKRNFIIVLGEIATHGRALWNTLIFCVMSVGAALLINPLAAYALSRYKPRCQYKVLLFCMLTMAFPPMVVAIPSFLLLRSLGLLNTYWALILPGMANGYSIFLLKGFFDSLPRELYEAAMIDGASEITMFWHVTMALSKPILAVIALGAFTGAYGNFMMAFILCQKESMWTLMVYLYQLQQRSTPEVSYAALLIAAIPTMLIFIFCQRLIIRGIVVPVDG